MVNMNISSRQAWLMTFREYCTILKVMEGPKETRSKEELLQIAKDRSAKIHEQIKRNKALKDGKEAGIIS